MNISSLNYGDGSAHILSDPTAFEEPLLDSTISVVLGSSNDDNVILVSQHGVSATGKDNTLSVCIRMAKERKKKLVQVLENATGLQRSRHSV